MIRPAAIIILLLCGARLLPAQQLALDTYTPANGLVDTRVTQLFQDSKGCLYFLTREGFSIFDGQHFDNYANGQSSPSQIMSGISEYSNGLVRLFTFSGVMYNVNRTRVTVDTTKKALLNEINAVHRVGTDDNLIVTNHEILREKNNQFITLNKPYTGAQNLIVASSLLYRQFILLALTNNSTVKTILLYNYETQQIVDSVPDIFFTWQAKDNSQNLYVLTNRVLQLNKAALELGKIKLVEPPFASLIPPSFKTGRFFFDAGNNLWLVNGNEFCKINLVTRKITIYNSGNGILDAGALYFQDAEKNDWLISGSKGVQKLQHTPLTKINTIANRELGPVLNVNIDEKGNRFIQTTTAMYLNDKVVGSVNTSIAKSFYAYNQLWQFTDYKTLKGSGGITFHVNDYIPSYTAENFQPGYLSFDNDGRTLISGATLFLIDKDLKFHVYEPGYYFDNAVTDNQNNYWLFQRSNEVNRLSWKNGRLELKFKKVIPGLNPRAALQWDRSTFIIGTRNDGIKLLRWNGNNLTETGSINKAKGLSNNFVYYLMKKNDQLIVATGTGLDRIEFQPKDTIIENLAIRNNIFSPFYFLCLQKDSSLLALTGNGELYQLKDDTAVSKSFLPSPFFRHIKVNNEIADSLHRFSYNKNNFFFSIGAPSFFDNKNIKYAFFLTGNGQFWEQHTTSADFAIANLQPGNYTMKVTIHYPGRFYPDQELSYFFIVNKPFWKQWWFVSLAVLACALTGFYLVRSYYHRQLEQHRITSEKQQAVEKERTRIATDMHDDFGAAISRIKFISEKMQLTQKANEGLVADLSKISVYSDEMAEKMNEIVWALNQRYDSCEDLVSFCRSYTSEYLQDKNIKLYFDSGSVPDKKIQGELRRNIFLVLKEALRNIVKHAGATEVRVSFIFNNDIQLTIADNGKGFRPENIRRFANGLANMKKRIADINGSIYINGENGTRVTLKVGL
jgi:signal transduction histidine kinase